jgi:hypothetical protein
MERRRENRLIGEVPGWYRIGDAPQHDIAFGAISASGCRLNQVEPNLAIGDVIALNLGPIGPVQATVRWRRQDGAGVEFRDPLDPAIVAYFAAFCGTSE